MKRVVSSRYQWLKLGSAIEEFVLGLRSPQVSSSATAAADQASQAAGGSLGSAIEKAKQAYNSQLTSVMYIAGAAMAPGGVWTGYLQSCCRGLANSASGTSTCTGAWVKLNLPLCCWNCYLLHADLQRSTRQA